VLAPCIQFAHGWGETLGTQEIPLGSSVPEYLEYFKSYDLKTSIRKQYETSYDLKTSIAKIYDKDYDLKTSIRKEYSVDYKIVHPNLTLTLAILRKIGALK
jgi:hypothetical protein